MPSCVDVVRTGTTGTSRAAARIPSPELRITRSGSCWRPRAVLHECGFDRVDIAERRAERNGHRVLLFAERAGSSADGDEARASRCTRSARRRATASRASGCRSAARTGSSPSARRAGRRQAPRVERRAPQLRAMSLGRQLVMDLDVPEACVLDDRAQGARRKRTAWRVQGPPVPRNAAAAEARRVRCCDVDPAAGAPACGGAAPGSQEADTGARPQDDRDHVERAVGHGVLQLAHQGTTVSFRTDRADHVRRVVDSRRCSTHARAHHPGTQRSRSRSPEAKWSRSAARMPPRAPGKPVGPGRRKVPPRAPASDSSGLAQ